RDWSSDVCSSDLFRAVDHIIIAVFAGGRLQIGNVRACAGLAHPKAADEIACDGGGEIFALQLFRAVVGERRGAHIGLDADGGAYAHGAEIAKLFSEGDLKGKVERRSAIFHRRADAEQARIAEPLHHLMGGENAFFLPLVDMRVHMFIDTPPGDATDFIMLMGPDHFYCLYIGRMGVEGGGYISSQPWITTSSFWVLT